MTSPNEWWKEEPYCEIESHGTRDDEYFIEVYDIPAIIEEVKRRCVEREFIICAAVMAEDGTIYRGHRHGYAMKACRETGRKLFQGHEQQGFITSRNRYVPREEARKLQDDAGIKSADPEGYRGKTLFSEDLY